METYHTPLTVPVELSAIRNFFGWFTDVKHREKPAAFSTVRQYKSALKWLYEEKEVIIEPAVDQGLETLLSGYKRKVSDLKLAGRCLCSKANITSRTTATVSWPRRSSLHSPSVVRCSAGHTCCCSGILSLALPLSLP